MSHRQQIQRSLRDADMRLDAHDNHTQRRRSNTSRGGVRRGLVHHCFRDGRRDHGEEGFVVQEGGGRGAGHLCWFRGRILRGEQGGEFADGGAETGGVLGC